MFSDSLNEHAASSLDMQQIIVPVEHGGTTYYMPYPTSLAPYWRQDATRARANRKGRWRKLQDNDKPCHQQLASVSAPQATSTMFQERVLRLALFGCYTTSAEAAIDKAALRIGSLISDFVSEVSTSFVDVDQIDAASTLSGSTLSYPSQNSLIERTHSTRTERTQSALTERSQTVLSMASISTNSVSSSHAHGFAFLTSRAPWELAHVVHGHGRVHRFGIDLCGVVFTSHAKQVIWRAVEGVLALVNIFGAENVFIVSKVKLWGGMHFACSEALSKPGGFLDQVGMPLENVIFVPCVDGPHGKGAVCGKLGLTHFVDDRFEVLEVAFGDPAGNSGEYISKLNGKLFHFAHGGSGTYAPEPPTGMSECVALHYHAVSGWAELLAHFDVDLNVCSLPCYTATTFVKRHVEEHRILVSEDESIAFRMIPHLTSGFGEIEDFAGVKITLRGNGSPYAQPQSAAKGPLTIVIRTKAECGEALLTAIPDVEALLADALDKEASNDLLADTLRDVL